MKKRILILSLAIICSGCNTLLNPENTDRQEVSLLSTPSGIAVYEQTRSGQNKLGVTPASVMLTPEAGKIFIFKAKGFQPQIATLKAQGDPTRNEYQFMKNEVHVTMRPARQ